jgi:ribose transport system ATP-binding protein
MTATTETRILEIRNVSKQFPGVRALDNVNFDCVKGEVHALCGENGAGKSTLLKILVGAYRPDEGQMLLRNVPVLFSHPQDAQKAGISIIYQEFNLLQERTVAQNIYLGREPMRGLWVDQATMDRQAQALLHDLGIEIDPRTMVGELRVAQQQIVEIAKALSLNPDILLMDEPTAALSPAEVDTLLAIVQKLSQRGVTIIYISHRLEEIFRIANRVTVLKDGKHITTQSLSTVTPDDLVRYMVGRELNNLYPPKAADTTNAKIIFEVKNLYVSDWLKNINLQVRAGEVVGIAGLEGSGRTFLARSLFGAESVNRGEIFLHGQKLNIKRPSDAIQAGIGFITEDRKREGLVLTMSIRRNIVLASLNLVTLLGVMQFKSEQGKVEALTQSLDVRGAGILTEVQFLSGGNQQKVVLAKWLATHAKLLIFDEPTRGIDVGAKASIHTLMRELADQGIGIIMISSELPEIIGMSDRIYVMRRGELTTELPGNQVTEESIIAAATLSLADDVIVHPNHHKEGAPS